MKLSQQEVLRYARHLPVIGCEGQEQLKCSRVLVVGAGGLGCPVLQYLTAAGVGSITIADGDEVELSNLQRQILFTEAGIGKNKALVAKEKLSQLNAWVNFNVHEEFLDANNAEKLIAQHDVIVDATDNYQARYVLNRFCRALKKPLVSASIYQFEAQISVFNGADDNAPCYECLYPQQPDEGFVPNCSQAGVLGVLPGVIGCLQATEVIKCLLKIGKGLTGRMLSVDLLTMQFNEFKVNRRATCRDEQCSPQREDKMIVDGAIHIKEMSVTELSEALKRRSDVQLVDVREDYEREICHINGVQIPLGQLDERFDELDSEKETVVYCKAGMRSRTAALILLQCGFKRVFSMQGGILAWIDAVDSSLMRY